MLACFQERLHCLGDQRGRVPFESGALLTERFDLTITCIVIAQQMF
jgi:hypothetical protein